MAAPAASFNSPAKGAYFPIVPPLPHPRKAIGIKGAPAAPRGGLSVWLWWDGRSRFVLFFSFPLYWLGSASERAAQPSDAYAFVRTLAYLLIYSFYLSDLRRSSRFFPC